MTGTTSNDLLSPLNDPSAEDGNPPEEGLALCLSAVATAQWCFTSECCGGSTKSASCPN